MRADDKEALILLRQQMPTVLFNTFADIFQNIATHRIPGMLSRAAIRWRFAGGDSFKAILSEVLLKEAVQYAAFRLGQWLNLT